MARPLRQGLDYFPLDVDIFEDEKLLDVQNEYGPLGESIYLRLLCWIYKNGYYLEFKNIDKLAARLIKSIGGKWTRNKQTVCQVILYLAECNLFSSELMTSNVITSVSIQERYIKATERRRSMNNRKYWLLDKNDNHVFPAHKKSINVCNNPVNVYNNLKNDDGNSQSKVKEINNNKPCLSAYYLNNINPMPSPIMLEELESFVDDGITYECGVAIIDYCRDERKTNWSYIRAVFNNCLEKRVFTPELFSLHLSERRGNRDEKANNRDKGTGSGQNTKSGRNTCTGSEGYVPNTGFRKR